MPMLQQGRGKGRHSTKARGDAAEDDALALLQARGLRFDVVLIEGGGPVWLPAAFDAG